jgi:hypothetical protein
MRKRLVMGVLGASFLALAGCASILDGMWEEEARANCDRESGQTRRSDCQDRVDRQVRDLRD